MILLFPLLLLILPTISISTSSESYNEILTIQPLVDGKVNSNFNFIMRGKTQLTVQQQQQQQQQQHRRQGGQNIIANHHTLLPPSLTSIISRYSITSFHLTLSSGRYASHWPLYPSPSPSSSSSSSIIKSIPQTPSSGIELYAYLKILPEETEGQERKRWEGFLGALGGLFCAGIEGGSVNEDSPSWGFEFDGREEERDENRLYRTLQPKLSATCTESLTPFLSLLPCSSQAGLSSLLNPHTLFDGDWTLLGVHFTKGLLKGEDESESIVRLEVGSVGDPVRLERKKGGISKRDFSFTKLYDRTLNKSCPVAKESKILLTIPGDSIAAFEILPVEGMIIRKEDDREVAVWDSTIVSQDTPLDISMTWPGESQFHPPKLDSLNSSPISTRRLLSGYGQERGKIGIELSNHLSRTAEVIWIETWPWWIRGFISSLKAEVSDISGMRDSVVEEAKILKLDYTPSIARKRPTTLQVLVSLPPNSITRFEVDYESAYLWYTEYRSDAHRGFEIPGATLILLAPSPSNSSAGEVEEVPIELRKHQYRIHTPSTLLSIPTPDFSMPYNVIILTSTAMALFFGSVMNVFVRSWLVVDLDGEDEEEEGERGEKDGKLEVEKEDRLVVE